MIYDTKTWEYPYLYNLIDQYRSLEKYNNGYAYNMMFVGPGWLNKMGRWEQPYELLKKSYEDGMKYYGDLKKEGKLADLVILDRDPLAVPQEELRDIRVLETWKDGVPIFCREA